MAVVPGNLCLFDRLLHSEFLSSEDGLQRFPGSATALYTCFGESSVRRSCIPGKSPLDKGYFWLKHHHVNVQRKSWRCGTNRHLGNTAVYAHWPEP